MDFLAPGAKSGGRAGSGKLSDKGKGRVDFVIECIAKPRPDALVIERSVIQFRARFTQKPDGHGALPSPL